MGGAKLSAEQRKAMIMSYAQRHKKANTTPRKRVARPTARTAQDDIETQDQSVDTTETPDTSTDNADAQENKEAKRLARKIKRRAFRVAQEEHSEDIEEIVQEDEDTSDRDVVEEVAEEATEAVVEALPEGEGIPFEEVEDLIEDAVKDAVEAVAKRKASKRKLASKARKMAETADGELSDDLVKDEPDSAPLPQKDTETEVAVSDDLTDESITPDGPTKDNGEGVKPPASVEAMREQFVAALDLVKTEKAAGILAPSVKEAAMCDEYMNKYTTKEMKIAANKIRSVGTAQKTAGISPAKHASIKHKKTASAGSEIGSLY